MAKSFVFYLGLALLFTHEMDSMLSHEWRVLPLVRSLPDDTGQFVFLVAHVPLFVVAIAFIASLNPRTRRLARHVASGFFILHAVLHYLFSRHAAYEFGSVLSSMLIYGAAMCGVVYFFVVARYASRFNQVD
jgi:hypothetical protein